MHRLDKEERSYWRVIFLWWGWTNVGMGVGGLWYRMLVESFSGGFDVAGELFLLFLFLGGGEANISGSTGFSSASGGLLSSGEAGVSNIRLDSVSKQMPASKYGWGVWRDFQFRTPE